MLSSYMLLPFLFIFYRVGQVGSTAAKEKVHLVRQGSSSRLPGVEIKRLFILCQHLSPAVVHLPWAILPSQTAVVKWQVWQSRLHWPAHYTVPCTVPMKLVRLLMISLLCWWITLLGQDAPPRAAVWFMFRLMPFLLK